MLQIRTGASAIRLRDGALLPSEVSHVTDAYDRAENAPAFLDAIGRPVESVASDIRSIVKAEGITDVFCDYIQAVSAKEKQQDRRLHLAYCGRVLTDAIKDSNASGVLGSQLTEDTSTGKLRARDCEDLHNAAEVLIFGRVDQEAKLDASGKKNGAIAKKWIWAEKVKEGPAKFRVDLIWDENSACFRSDYDDRVAAELPFDGAPSDDFGPVDYAGGY